MPRAHRVIQRSVWLQLGIVLACWLAGEVLARAVGLPIPGAILGLAIMLVLLTRRRLSAVSMRRGAEWLLADMLLFFVPAVLADLNYPEFLGFTGLKILFVILASTVAVMVTTALVVDSAYRWRAGRDLASSDSR
jgi:holin-like protein